MYACHVTVKSVWCHFPYRPSPDLYFVTSINFLLTESVVNMGKNQTEVWYFPVMTKRSKLIRGLLYDFFKQHTLYTVCIAWRTIIIFNIVVFVVIALWKLWYANLLCFCFHFITAYAAHNIWAHNVFALLEEVYIGPGADIVIWSKHSVLRSQCADI